MKKEFDLGNKKILIETGEVAKQANGSVIVKLGETSVLVTAVISKDPIPEEEDFDYLPLTVDYRERTYASGKIPGGFFKREGRPRDEEILTSRVVDRSIRPLFPKYINHKMQVSILVLSSDGENDSDAISVLGASTALCISEIPFYGPIGCVRVGLIDNEFVLNPVYEQQLKSSMNLLVSGTGEKIIMIETGANEISEEKIISAIEFAKPYLGKLCEIQKEIVKDVGKQKIIFEEKKVQPEIFSEVENLLKQKIQDITSTKEKQEREKIVSEVLKEILTELKPKFGEDKKIEKQIKLSFEKVFRNEIRKFILENKKRLDGRESDEIRDVSCKVSFLPRIHGSALFTRGKTQSLVTVTLGTPRDMQVMEELEGEYKERFLFHYNFPGFATGDIKPDRSPSRREIGHGALAKKAIYPLLPKEEEFPYTVRIVSDILESNGSSSMASVCGGSLALFDAGIPVKEAVAGVAMGLIKEDDNYLILTDIMGLEDHIGDMDFKVAGTKNGITAIQLDLKIDGITTQLISEILEQAKLARLKILDIMNKTIDKPRQSLSSYAPQIRILQIPQTKIGDLIGSGGKNIRQITEETNTTIDIEEDGRVFISGTDTNNVELAKQMVEYYTADIEIGKIYNGKVTRITDFGAFVEILPGKEGLVHISQLADYRVKKVQDIVKEGDSILVKVIDIDNQGRIVLSRKAALKDKED